VITVGNKDQDLSHPLGFSAWTITTEGVQRSLQLLAGYLMALELQTDFGGQSVYDKLL